MSCLINPVLPSRVRVPPHPKEAKPSASIRPCLHEGHGNAGGAAEEALHVGLGEVENGVNVLLGAGKAANVGGGQAGANNIVVEIDEVVLAVLVPGCFPQASVLRWPSKQMTNSL